MARPASLESSSDPALDKDLEKAANETEVSLPYDKDVDSVEAVEPEMDELKSTRTAQATPGGLRDVLSRVSSIKPIHEDGPPPDGGLMAWTVALMGHLVVFNTWGFVNSFGPFQTHYVETLGHPPSDISWIGSVQIFLLFFLGTFSGRWTDMGYFRHIFLMGSFLELLGVFMTSLSTKYYQLFLAQGICVGLGNGLMFAPALAVLSTYFTKHRSVAISIGACGTGTGGLVFPAIIRQLLPKIGFAWTVRVLGLIMLINLIIANIFLRTRIAPRKTGPIVDLSAFKDVAYTLFAIGMFLVFWGLYFAFYYIGSFGRDIIGISQADSISLIMILNGVGIIGRLVPAYVADRYTGPLNMLLGLPFVASLILYCWIAVKSRGGLIAFAVVYGLFAAGIQGLFPSILSSLTPDLQKVGIRIGMIFTIVSFASLTGAPIGGALLQKGNGNYLYAQLFAATTILVGGFVIVAARLSRTGLKLRQRM